ncbi:putative cobaltochelatase [Candidatus Oleimmundimicrobium sp.]|uniref:putative cobaltochelatase n=1 Tax=Candidatus Oleimmundimicrobium sp. TaxID=3060597 RepID=UPI0027195CCA|nr:putative cobaltochelatase [Candidatus Oleimmundimicrobium sp.]MDO8886224.1 putative cobaltochelatase [Candidatus Oleimmundimicrobium sp.]
MSCLAGKVYSFTAIVGQDKMKKALILNVINPKLGGVLIKGQKGTAKSTAVRALADLLPEIEVVEGCPFGCNPHTEAEMCPHCLEKKLIEDKLPLSNRKMKVVTLPINATEDRVVGTLDIEHAIKHGEKRFEPGILADSHRGFLYVDEVNLLDDHIVDILLDSAAMGVNTVERESVSFSHPAHFILVGTMNPEEGDLRPQLLDRFALCVEVEGINDTKERVEIIKRRMSYENDPHSFGHRWEDTQENLRRQVLAAEALLPKTEISDDMLHLIAEICVEMGVHGHRADIVMMKTAKTIAAFHQRREVTEKDVKEAAELALPHRMKRKPFEEQKLDQEKLEQTIEKHKENQSKPEQEQEKPQEPSENQEKQEGVPDGSSSKTFDVGAPFKTKEIKIPKDKIPRATGGRRAKSVTESKSGRYVRSVIPKDKTTDIAFDATIRAAAIRNGGKKNGEAGLKIEKSDLRQKVREKKVGSAMLFVTDASGSMGAKERMVAAKGAVLSLLVDAYQRRDKVGLITFRGKGAELLLPLTDNVENAQNYLKKLPTGGKTPLAHGLTLALETFEKELAKNKKTLPLMVLITDGKANVSINEKNAVEEAREIAERIAEAKIKSLVIDTENDFLNLGLAKDLANACGGEYIKLEELEAEELSRLVKEKETNIGR